MSRFARWTSCLVFASALLASGTASAATIPFALDGNAGLGLLPGNENHAVTNGGSGGLLSGISYDTVTNILTIHIGWGSGNGFTDLSGNANAGHIHGPTTNPAPTGFSQNAGVLIGLNTVTGWNGSASSGGFNGTVTLTEPQETLLLDERLYINIHTPTNTAGEIRGHLVVVPEPGALSLLSLGLLGLVVAGRRPRGA